MLFKRLLPLPSMCARGINSIVNPHLALLDIEKLEQLLATGIHDLFSQLQCLIRRSGPKVILRKPFCPENLASVVSQVEYPDFDAEPVISLPSWG